jgi:YD repeat-containing protein
VTDALNDTTTTDYDELGQAVKVTYADDSFTETLYGVNSQPVTRNDLPSLPSDFPSTFSGQHVVKIGQRKSTDTTPLAITHYLYDTEGRLTDVWQRLHSGNTDFWPHWHYTYDGMGNLASITDPNSHVTMFADTFAGSGNSLYLPGQKITHSRTLPAVGGSAVTEATRYDAPGRTLAVTDFKGQTIAYQYDDSAEGQGRLFAEYRFAAGVTAIDTSTNAINKSSAAERTEYSYDALGRQSQVREYTSGTGTTTTRVTNYAYDPVTAQVTLVDSPEGQVHHEYDPATGLMTRTWTGANSNSPTTDTLYGYDELGRLASVTAAKVNGSAPTPPAA